MKLQEFIGKKIAIRTEGRLYLIERLIELCKGLNLIRYGDDVGYRRTKYLFLDKCHLQFTSIGSNQGYSEISITEIDELKPKTLNDFAGGYYTWNDYFEFMNNMTLKNWSCEMGKWANALKEEKDMKLSDLKAGKHLAVARDGTKMLVMDGWFQLIQDDNPRSLKEWSDFVYYNEDLTNNGYRKGSSDIVKVYEISGGYFNGTISFDSCCKLIWERNEEVELTMDEVLNIVAKEKGVNVNKLKIRK